MDTTRVMCPKCREFHTAGGELVHQRWCDGRARAEQSRGSEKRMRPTSMFVPDDAAGLPPQLGAGGPRREDACVQIAADETEAITRAIPTEAPDVPLEDPNSNEPVAEGAEDASVEEVTEAMRRVLLKIGVDSGAKTCDVLIKLLHNPMNSHEVMKQGISSHRELVKDADKQLEDALLSMRFTKGMVEDDGEDEAQAAMWKRDAVDVVRRQIAQLTLDVRCASRLYVKPFEQLGDDGKRVISHPLSTPLAARVVSNVRNAAMKACMDGVEGVGGWRDGYDFVLLLQIHSDKSSQTLKTNSHTHFPLHVAVMNTSLQNKEKMIAEGDTVVGYLPTEVTWESEETPLYTTEQEDSVGGRGSRPSRLRILHNAMKECLEPLLSKTIPGFEVTDSRGRVLKCHPVLWSYVTDLPEGWDMSSSVHQRCSRCLTVKSELASTDPCDRKKACIISEYYDRYESLVQGREKTDLRIEMWDELPLSTTRPYLLSLGENFGVDLFRCIRFEQMHNIHLGLTRTILQSMSDRLRSKSLVSTEFRLKGSGIAKKFSTIRTTVLRALNVSMELFDRQSPWIGFKVCFTSAKKTVPLNGLFTDNGLASMLEAKDYARVLQVMPFLGATVDRLCGEGGTTTRLFVQYVELVYRLMRVRTSSASFTGDEIKYLRDEVHHFMEHAHDLYADHQKSEMGTPKMHTMMHVVDDIVEGGSLMHNRADMYEASHKKIKTAFNSGSRRGESGHEEALGVIARTDFLRMASGKTDRGARISVVSNLSQPKKRAYGVRTKAKVEAAEHDTVALSRVREVCAASVILDFLSSYERLGPMADVRSLPKPIKELIVDLGGGVAGYWSVPDFVWFMKKLNLGRADNVTRSLSCHVSGHPFPICETTIDGKKMLISVDGGGDGASAAGTVKRELQKVVAAHSYYGSKHPFQNTVMIESSAPEETKDKLHHSVRGKYERATVRGVWIAKVLAILKVTRKEADEVGTMPGRATFTEKVLVQYMDVCEESPDEVDKALGCTRLKWAREVYDDDVNTGNMDDERRFFDVLDIETVRGLVHVVRGDYGLGATRKYACKGDRKWTKVWFYLNRFKLDRSGATLLVTEKEDAREEPA